MDTFQTSLIAPCILDFKLKIIYENDKMSSKL